MAKVANVAEALRKEVARERKVGPSVLVRAIAKGFYGYPLADIRLPGEEFKMRVADLQLYKLDAKGQAPKYYNGVEKRFVEHEGKKYELPTWCEDAKAPSSVVEDTGDEEEEFAEGEDIL